MSLSGFPIPRFGGLNLVDDPEEVGAIGSVDQLNIDIDKHGRVRSRDGYNNLLSAASATRLDAIAAFYMSNGTKQLLVSSNVGNLYRAYSTAGAVVASVAAGNALWEADFTRYGGPTGEVAYATSSATNPAIATPLANPVFRWSGAAWAFVGTVGLGATTPLQLEVKADDNRLVGSFEASNSSRVGFSNAGAPETWTATDYVDVTPGDGERITSLAAWRELVFVFKETKYFVFTTTSPSGTGTPIFNYRPVITGVGAIGRQCTITTPSGVYFLSRRGIYKTTGGDPTLVSRALDPIFRGGASSTYTGGVLNHAAIWACRLMWHDERLYFAYPSGSSTTADRILVFDPETDQWVLWNIGVGAMASFRISDSAELVFTYPTGTNDIGRMNSTFTDDDGVSIASSYQSGFYQPSPTNEVTTRWTELWGTGSPTFNIFTNHAASDLLTRGGTVTLGTAPQVAKGTHLKAYTGQLLSHKLSSTSSAWSVNRIEHQITNVFQPS